MGMIYGGETYMFSKNLQGDVIGIYNENRQLVAKYQYNAYGEITAITDANGNDVSGNATHIANINPFRYRGYYYDTETGFYYLQSRYYDPVVGRFLNSDAIIGANGGVVGYNLFAYCSNNSVNFIDYNGYFLVPIMPQAPFMFYEATLEVEDEISAPIDPNVPPDHPDFKPSKKKNKVKNPNGNGWGWEAKDGGVWIHTPNMHGGEGWTIQYPGGDHSHAYPGGHVRNHFKAVNSSGKAKAMILVGLVITVVLAFDDFTGIGAADDFLLGFSTSLIYDGIDEPIKERCSVCGEERYR